MKTIILRLTFICIGFLFTGCGATLSSELSEPLILTKSLDLSEKEKNVIKNNIAGGEGYILSNDTIYLDKKYVEMVNNDRSVKDRDSYIKKQDSRLKEFKNEYPLALSEYTQLKPKITDWINYISKLKPKYSFENSENIDPIIMKSIEKSIILEAVPKSKLNPENIYAEWRFNGENIYLDRMTKRLDLSLDNYLKERYPIFLYSVSSDYVKKINSPYIKTNGQIFEKDINNVVINLKDGFIYKFLPNKFSADDENINVTFSFENGYYYAIIGNKKSEYINVKSVSMYVGEDIISYKNLFKLPPYAKNQAESISFKIKTQYQPIYSKLMNYGLAVEYEINGKNKTIFIQKQNKE